MNSLYRIYRPKNFDEVDGQQDVVKVLQQSIKKDNVNHAYLFSGSRGTGKTSVARIFANEIHCDPIDIVEIDAASQNSVENVRELSEIVRTVPLKSDKKVYILDEVHMFSKSAFNAFLKILEEPPVHSIFILATTELDKVPDTIISRCQLLSFKKPSINMLEETILKVAKKEGYKMDKPTTSIIALLSDGSFRDALGVLQKVIIASDNKNITRESIQSVLNVPRSESINEYISAFANKDVKAGLSIIEKCADDNIDMNLFLKFTLRKVRVILLYGFTKSDKLLEDYVDSDQVFIKEAISDKKINLDILNSLLSMSTKIKTSYISQLPLEIALIEYSNL